LRPKTKARLENAVRGDMVVGTSMDHRLRWSAKVNYPKEVPGSTLSLKTAITPFDLESSLKQDRRLPTSRKKEDNEVNKRQRIFP
jgi:hypothetical protein